MRFKMDRLCELAGIKSLNNRSSGLISEGGSRGAIHEDELEAVPITKESEGRGMDKDEGRGMDEEDAMMDDGGMEEESGLDEVIEIDEVVLVQELRRAKRIMNESKKKAVKIRSRKKQNLQEAQLKAIIDQEVQNVLKDLNLNSGWVYGNKKPTRSRHGYSHQGSFLKGIGFK